MKTYNHLFEQMLKPEVIALCIDRAAKGKRNRKEVRRILEHKGYHIMKIRELLLNGEFVFPRHKPSKITERGKERLIIKPHFKYELIIQHMIVYCLEPIFTPRFYAYSCASIPKRGISYGKKALERYIRKFVRQNGENRPLYAYKADITKFFENVSIPILEEKLKRYVRDKRFLKICFDLLESQDIPGLPLGYVTSQWFANFYLTDFDNFIKQELKAEFYCRYMDDIVILSSSKTFLHYMKTRIEDYLMNRDLLSIKSNWQIYPIKSDDQNGRAIDFMGFKFYMNKVTLRKKTLRNTRRHVWRIQKRDRVNVSLAASIISRLGWLKQAMCYTYYLKFMKMYVSISRLKQIVSRRSCHESNLLRFREQRVSAFG